MAHNKQAMLLCPCRGRNAALAIVQVGEGAPLSKFVVNITELCPGILDPPLQQVQYAGCREGILMAATALQGKAWRSALAGHDINAANEEAERQRLLLERFQEEVRALQSMRRYLLRRS